MCEKSELQDYNSKCPEKIYLNVGGYQEAEHIDFINDEITWCQDKIELQDVEYIRADIYENYKLTYPSESTEN